MALLDPTTKYAVGGTALVLLVGFLLSQPNSLVKWLRKKNYQYEVTFALYMLTPTEKFIFNSVLFLMLSMFMIMCFLYLPNHIATISRRTYYYFAGDTAVASHIGGTASKASEAVMGAATDIAGAAYQAAVNTAAAAQEAVNQAAEHLGFD